MVTGAVLCKAMARLGQEFRSLFDKQYRRAFRNLRHLPRHDYRYVIDAGANRGSFTDAFLLLHQPQRVVLVEAIPELAEHLRARYAGDPRFRSEERRVGKESRARGAAQHSAEPE